MGEPLPFKIPSAPFRGFHPKTPLMKTSPANPFFLFWNPFSAESVKDLEARVAEKGVYAREAKGEGKFWELNQ